MGLPCFSLLPVSYHWVLVRRVTLFFLLSSIYTQQYDSPVSLVFRLNALCSLSLPSCDGHSSLLTILIVLHCALSSVSLSPQ